MGILSVVHRNLISKSQFKYLSSSNLRFIRRISSPAVHESGLSKAQSPHASTCDLKSNNKPMFLIEHFYNRSGNYDNEYSWDRSPSLYNYSVIPAEKSWKDHHNLCNPFSRLGSCKLAGSCKELMLLFFSYEICLWDPTINEIKILPESNVPAPPPISASTTTILESTTTLAYGFGFDPQSSDYKVLRFIMFDYADGSGSFSCPPQVELYSLKTNSWKQITNTYTSAPLQNPCVHVNGVYYWGDLFSTHVNILSFDFASEMFSSIRLAPELFERFRRLYDFGCEFNFVLVEFDGSLALVVYLGNMVKPFSFEVWGWNGESWHERVPRTTVDVPGGVVELGLFQEDMLFLQNGVGELMLFDLAKRNLEGLGIHANMHYVEVFPFVGSSVLFHTMGNK